MSCSCARGAAAVFPLAAADLMPALQGEALGDALRAARQAWTDSDFTLDRDTLLCIARGNESQPDA